MLRSTNQISDHKLVSSATTTTNHTRRTTNTKAAEYLLTPVNRSSDVLEVQRQRQKRIKDVCTKYESM